MNTPSLQTNLGSKKRVPKDESVDRRGLRLNEEKTHTFRLAAGSSPRPQRQLVPRFQVAMVETRTKDQSQIINYHPLEQSRCISPEARELMITCWNRVAAFVRRQGN